MAYDIPSISDLEAIQLLNKHYAEVITSKEGGVSSAADITQTTNPITGVVRRTLYKILDDMDDTFLERLLKMAFTPVGTFTAGATLTDARQTLLWEASEGGDGHYYSWSGSFPKIVAPSSSPSPITSGSWVDRTDDSLRDEIRETVFQNMKRQAAEAGLNLVDGSFEEGGSLTWLTDVLWCQVDGKYYSWGGALPHVIAAGTNPVGNADWTPQTDPNLRSDLAASDGYKYIGEVQSFAALRLLVPTIAGVRVKLRGWYSGSVAGGGDFIAMAGSAIDDGGVIASVNASWHWKRVLNDAIWPEMFGAKNDGVTDDITSVNSCMAAASTYGKKVVPYSAGTLLCGAPVTVPGGVKVYGAGRLKFKRGASVNTALDFITVGANALINKVEIDGSRVTTQAPAEVVLMRVGNGAEVTECKIYGSIGYLIVANVTVNVVIKDNELYNSAGCAVALYGDSSGSSANAKVNNNNIYDIGAGAVLVQQYNSVDILRNKCTGVLVGGPGNRMYVNTNVSGAVVRVAGPDFTAAKPGMWVVLPGGSEHRITAVSSASNITVSPPPPSTQSNIRAMFGTGDLIGVQSCNYVTVESNDIRNGVTYGTGGGTTIGNSNQLNYCSWVNNIVCNTGKNGINLSQSGASCLGNSIRGNTLILCGNGGIGTSNAYLLPAFDTAAIALYQANAGLLLNTKVTDNEVITFSGDLGAGDSWFSMSGLSQGTVIAFGNSQSGYADGYVRGDILSVNLTGYGTGATLTNNVSTGDRVVISIQTGTTPTSSPFFVVNKVIRSPTAPVLMAQVATTTGNVAFCWGLQTSTASSWAVGHNATPSGNITYHLRG